MSTNTSIRNIAIIAHVDHGKTTLVDQMFRQAGLFRENQQVGERLMDNMDLEKERGITISAKNCAVRWGEVKINILDTPGHADFGGEVERALMMVDGALLLVDASEGPLPQTRFVLRKALEAGLKIIVVINKIDRGDARPNEVLDEIYELFIDLEATDEQIEFPLVYAIAKEGIAQLELEEKGQDLVPLMEMIVEHLPAPEFKQDAPFQMLVADLGYSEYLGRLAIGRIANGSVSRNDTLICINENQDQLKLKASKLQVYEGLMTRELDQVDPGEILVLSGIEEVHIGDTICTLEQPKPLKRISVDEPTISMLFGINTSPLAGQEGKWVQSAKIRDRLRLETLRNVSLEMEDSSGEAFLVKGRGELQMAILIETMRREGFEMGVSRPEVVTKVVDGEVQEPYEQVVIDVEDQHQGSVMEELGMRKGEMTNMEPDGKGRVRLEFIIPSRGLIGFRGAFLTLTSGSGIMTSVFDHYGPVKQGETHSRQNGALVSMVKGKTAAFALYNIQARGRLFLGHAVDVYEGQIVGIHSRGNDLVVNPIKGKQLTNVRASGTDEALTLVPPIKHTLEQALEFIEDDELVEVTPLSIRLRKKLLTETQRKRAPK